MSIVLSSVTRGTITANKHKEQNEKWEPAFFKPTDRHTDKTDTLIDRRARRQTGMPTDGHADRQAHRQAHFWKPRCKHTKQTFK